MIWVVLTIIAVAVVTLIAMQVSMRRDVKKLDVRLQYHIVSTSTRQSRVVNQVVTRRNPQVDAVARTVKRDSNDLPLTGRMSTGVHRKKNIS